MKKIQKVVGLAVVYSVACPGVASVVRWSSTKIAGTAHLLANCLTTLRLLNVSHHILESEVSDLNLQWSRDPASQPQFSIIKNDSNGNNPQAASKEDPYQISLRRHWNVYLRQSQSLQDSLAEIKYFQKSSTKDGAELMKSIPTNYFVDIVRQIAADLPTQVVEGDMHVLSSVMTGGKTAKLFDYAESCKRLSLPFEVFFPKCAVGKGAGESRNGSKLEGQPLGRKFSFSIHNYFRPETKVLLVDEGHFLNKRQALELVMKSLVGYKIIVAGLAVDFKGDPFPVINLLSSLDNPPKDALCPICGKGWATQHIRSKDNASNESVNVGQNKFFPACIRCWMKATYDDKNYSHWLKYLLAESGISARLKIS